MFLNKRATASFYTLLILSIISIILLIGRIYIKGSFVFVFLAWNLLLALVPLVCALLIFNLQKKYEGLKILLLVIWLFFYPNAPYILTDYIHLSWSNFIVYDAILITFFALAGLLAGLLSMYLVFVKLFHRLNKYYSWAIITLCSILTGFGIYLGRFLRFNSWDIITDRSNLLRWTTETLARSNLFYLAVVTTLTTAIIHISFFFIFYKLLDSKKRSD